MSKKPRKRTTPKKRDPLWQLRHALGHPPPMRNLTATLCLTLAVLLGSAGMSVSQDFQKGVDAYDTGDYSLALDEFTPLAEQGDASAQYNLGEMYRRGDGVPQDFATAMKWYTLAAEQGNASAQYTLGLMYYNGQGVPQDYVYAQMWWNIAASSGNKKASENRDLVAKEMIPPQLAEAQRLARECVAKNYKGC
jgi:TPR repeat protein